MSRAEQPMPSPEKVMGTYLVAGIGRAYSVDDCSALTSTDEDLWKQAINSGVVAKLAGRVGGCSTPPRVVLYGDAWVVVGRCEPHKLDADPGVVAYCEVAS